MPTQQDVVGGEVANFYDESNRLDIQKVRISLPWIDIIDQAKLELFISSFVVPNSLEDRAINNQALFDNGDSTISNDLSLICTLGYGIFLELELHKRNNPSTEDTSALITYLCRHFELIEPVDVDITQKLLNSLEMCKGSIQAKVTEIIRRLDIPIHPIVFLSEYNKLMDKLKELLGNNDGMCRKRRLANARKVPDLSLSSSDDEAQYFRNQNSEDISHRNVTIHLLKSILNIPRNQGIPEIFSQIISREEHLSLSDMLNFLRIENTTNCPRVMLERVLSQFPLLQVQLELAVTSTCGSATCRNQGAEMDKVHFLHLQRPTKDVCLSILLRHATSLLPNCPTCSQSFDRRWTVVNIFRSTQNILIFLPVFDDQLQLLKKKICGWNTEGFLFQGSIWRVELVIFHTGNARNPHYTVAKRDGSRFIYINDDNYGEQRFPTDADEKTTAFLLKRVTR